jgi:hypothetical protein
MELYGNNMSIDVECMCHYKKLALLMLLNILFMGKQPI